MDNESLVGAIIMCIVCCGCGALFFGIGVFANRLEKPMHFWSGSTIDPKTVNDIPEYNRKNAVMWKWYSLPYWLAGIFGALGCKHEWCTYVALAFLLFASIPGLAIIIACYKRIEREHIVKPKRTF